jgi:hypothetical protein
MKKFMIVKVWATVSTLLLMVMSYQYWTIQNTVTEMAETLTTIRDNSTEIMVDVGELNDTVRQELVFRDTAYAKKYGLNDLSEEKMDKILEIYDATAHTGHQLTLTAIAWKESRASSWPVNLNDPSCGPFHNKIVNVMQREKIEDSKFNRNLVCARLIHELDFSIKHAILEIEFWEKRHKGVWRKVVASYNGGHKGNREYAQEVAEILTAFRRSNIHRIALGLPEPTNT